MSAPIDDARLAEMQARCDRATLGPWHIREESTGYGARVIARLLAAAPIAKMYLRNDDGRETADFIAAARTDLPDLIAEVRRLRETIARVDDAAIHPDDVDAGEWADGWKSAVMHVRAALIGEGKQ